MLQMYIHISQGGKRKYDCEKIFFIDQIIEFKEKIKKRNLILFKIFFFCSNQFLWTVKLGDCGMVD